MIISNRFQKFKSSMLLFLKFWMLSDCWTFPLSKETTVTLPDLWKLVSPKNPKVFKILYNPPTSKKSRNPLLPTFFRIRRMFVIQPLNKFYSSVSREYIRIWELNYPFRPQKGHQKFPKRHLVEVFQFKRRSRWFFFLTTHLR